jgi:GDP/UDP-N,N'-diacetylbacillosamine 2-epimerase (hydrolysing)
MKLLFCTGSRSEWGYIRPILEICKKKKIKYEICATNMHLLDSFGNSVKEIEKDGFKVREKIYMSLDGYNNFTMTKSMFIFGTSLVDILQRVKPDWVILAGDRGETLIAAITAAYTNIPIAHIQAGELSGNIDGQARHAIGKFAHIHFASNLDAYNRLKKLGEEKFRIKLVGAPQLDDLKKIQNFENFEKIKKKYNLLKLKKKNYILVVYHPVTEEYKKTKKNVSILCDSLKRQETIKVWVLPNNDAGSSIVKNEIFNNKDPNNIFFDNLPRSEYLGLLKNCQLLIGNSSSGIIESSSFKVPVINLGRRQNNRYRPKNVIDLKTISMKLILKNIKKATSQKFYRIIKNITNPYGDGNSSKKIIKILKQTKVDDKLLFKSLTY